MDEIVLYKTLRLVCYFLTGFLIGYGSVLGVWLLFR